MIERFYAGLSKFRKWQVLLKSKAGRFNKSSGKLFYDSREEHILTNIFQYLKLQIYFCNISGIVRSSGNVEGQFFIFLSDENTKIKAKF